MNRAEWLVSMVKAHGFEYGVELGVKEGKTINHMLNACPDLSMIGIDLWESTPGYEDWDHEDYKYQAMNLCDSYPDRLRLIQGCTWETAESFENGTFDFIFVDGDHRTESVIKDITAWRSKIRPGGMLAGHDVGWPSVRAALDQCVPEFHMVGHDGCWVVMV